MDTQKYIKSLQTTKAYHEIKNTYGFLQGKPSAAHKLTLLVDPNCIFCHKLYTLIKPYIDAGDLQVNWILVDVFKASSKSKVAQILNAKDPAKLLEQDERTFNVNKEEGGIKGLTHIPEALTKKISANHAYFVRNHLIGVPDLIYSANGHPNIVQGYLNAEQFKQLLPTLSNAF